MKKRIMKRLFGFMLAAAIIISSMPAVFAAAPPEGAQITDIYSPWAEFDIFMAQAYGLGEEGTYSNFRGGATWGKFAPVYTGIAEAFGRGEGVEMAEIGDYLTRGTVVTLLYGLITRVLVDEEGPVVGSSEALAYFVDNGLIKGRASGDYQLDNICTVEEMIIFSLRAYEHLRRVTGDYSSGFFWQVNGGQSTVYLLGTVHLSDISIYPLSGAIEAAFDACENLVVEVNVAAMSEEDAAYIAQSELIRDGSTIADYISPELYEIYAAVFELLGIPAEIYDYIQPWAAMLALQNLMLMMGGESADSTIEQLLGMDMRFMLRAIEAGKNILELESVRLQIDMFGSLSRELQEVLLAEVLAAFVNMVSEQEDQEETEEQANMAYMALMMMLEAVRTGDEEILGMLLGVGVEYEPPYDEYFYKLLRGRDIGMAAGIAELLEDGENGDYFIIIGAAHFMGEGSIIDLLEEMGYEVERIR